MPFAEVCPEPPPPPTDGRCPHSASMGQGTDPPQLALSPSPPPGSPSSTGVALTLAGAVIQHKHQVPAKHPQFASVNEKQSTCGSPREFVWAGGQPEKAGGADIFQHGAALTAPP